MLNRVRPLHKGHLKTGVDSFCTEVETRFSAMNKMKLSPKRDWKTLANFGQGFCNKVVPSLSLRCEEILLELRAKPWDTVTSNGTLTIVLQKVLKINVPVWNDRLSLYFHPGNSSLASPEQNHHRFHNFKKKHTLCTGAPNDNFWKYLFGRLFES